MDTWIWIIVVIVVIATIAAVGYALMKRQRSARLKERFGLEYDRAVQSKGDRKDAESDLSELAERRDHIEIVPLSATSRRRYAADWDAVQNQFVDEPAAAVANADELIVSVMAERGYPVDDFDERAGMVAADQPDVVSHYHMAYAVRRHAQDATTEELREAFVHYRALFDRMLTDETDETGDTAEGMDRRGAHSTDVPGAHRRERHDGGSLPGRT